MDASQRMMLVIAIMATTIPFLSFTPTKAKTPAIISSAMAVAAFILSQIGYVGAAKIIAILAGFVFIGVMALIFSHAGRQGR